MATRQEIEKELKIALKEVGKITPWYDKEVDAWIFFHENYPSVECGGDTDQEVIEKFPHYLREFIIHRLNGNISPLMEKETKGHGGYRPGAGRPVGTVKESKQRIYVPIDLAEWLKEKSHWEQVRKLMSREKIKHA